MSSTAIPAPDGPAGLVTVMKYFDAKPAQFRAEWEKLTDDDKDAIRTGIGNGTLTY